VKGGKLITPPTPDEMRDAKLAEAMPYPKSAVLPGVTREAVVELAREAGIEVELAAINVTQLLDADELFLTNSIMQVMPVCRIEKSAVGNDKPGTVTVKLSKLYDDKVAAETD